MDQKFDDYKPDKLVKSQFSTILHVLRFQGFSIFDIVELFSQAICYHQFITVEDDMVKPFVFTQDDNFIMAVTDDDAIIQALLKGLTISYIESREDTNIYTTSYIMSMFSDSTITGVDDIKGRCVLFNSELVLNVFVDLMVILSFARDVNIHSSQYVGVTKAWYDDNKYNLAIATSSVANLLSEKMTLYGTEYVFQFARIQIKRAHSSDYYIVTFSVRGYNIRETNIAIQIIRPE